MKMQFWKRKQQQQPPSGPKRLSSSSTVTACSSDGRVPLSKDEINSTRTLYTSSEDNSPLQNERQRLDLMNARFVTPSAIKEGLADIANDIQSAEYTKDQITAEQSVVSRALSMSCPPTTRQIFEETRKEREASVVRGLAILQGMEVHAKTSLRKLIVDDRSDLIPSPCGSTCEDNLPARSTSGGSGNGDGQSISQSPQRVKARGIRSCPALPPVSPVKTGNSKKKANAFPREDELMLQLSPR